MQVSNFRSAHDHQSEHHSPVSSIPTRTDSPDAKLVNSPCSPLTLPNTGPDPIRSQTDKIDTTHFRYRSPMTGPYPYYAGWSYVGGIPRRPARD